MTSAPPRVSVIMPTHNRAELLRRSVMSVLAQTFRDLELIVVDDCSTDHTPDVLKEFSDPRLRVLRREVNGKAAATRNDGIAAARGELLAFQDDDDIWLPHKLERQVAALDRAGADVGLLLCSYIRWHPGGIKLIGGAFHWSRIDFSKGKPHILDYGLIATPGWLVRRRVLDQAGNFDTRFKSWDDWELGLRLWQKTKIAHLDEPLFIQDQVLGSQMMRNDRGQYEDLVLILDKHGAMWDHDRRLQADHHFFIARRAYLYVSPDEGRKWFRMAVRAWPWQLRSWGGLLLCALGSRTTAALVHGYRSIRNVLIWPIVTWRKVVHHDDRRFGT